MQIYINEGKIDPEKSICVWVKLIEEEVRVLEKLIEVICVWVWI